MAAADTLVLVAPQYAGDSRITAALQLATARIDLDSFAGSQQETAVAYLAAHVLTVADRGTAAGTSGAAASGPVSGMTTGGLSVSYDTSGAAGWWADAALQSTPYGREFLAMRAASLGSLPAWVR